MVLAATGDFAYRRPQYGVIVCTNGVLEVEKAGGGGEWMRAEKGFMILKSKGK